MSLVLTKSKYSLAKDNVLLAILPVGDDGRGINYSEDTLRAVAKQGVEAAGIPIVLTHDPQDRKVLGFAYDLIYDEEDKHLKAWTRLYPDGVNQFYGESPNWSCEVEFYRSKNKGFQTPRIKNIALLGFERPHFKNLATYSSFYHEDGEDGESTNNTEEVNMKDFKAIVDRLEKLENKNSKYEENEEVEIDPLKDINDAIDNDDLDNVLERIMQLNEELSDENEELSDENDRLKAELLESKDSLLEAQSVAAYAECGCSDINEEDFKKIFKSLDVDNRGVWLNTVKTIGAKAKTLTTSTVTKLYGEDLDKNMPISNNDRVIKLKRLGA